MFRDDDISDDKSKGQPIDSQCHGSTPSGSGSPSPSLACPTLEQWLARELQAIELVRLGATMHQKPWEETQRVDGTAKGLRDEEERWQRNMVTMHISFKT